MFGRNIVQERKAMLGLPSTYSAAAAVAQLSTPLTCVSMSDILHMCGSSSVLFSWEVIVLFVSSACLDMCVAFDDETFAQNLTVYCLVVALHCDTFIWGLSFLWLDARQQKADPPTEDHCFSNCLFSVQKRPGCKPDFQHVAANICTPDSLPLGHL